MGKPGWLLGSMFVKLFLALALVSMLVFSGLLYSALSSSREALIKQKSEDMTVFIERTGQYLELYLANIRNILLNVSGRVDEKLLADPAALRKMLNEQIEINSAIVSHMFIMNGDGEILSNDQLFYDIVGHPELPRLFRIAYENPGLVNWSEPYYSPLMTERTIAFALALKDGEGIVLAEINTSQLTARLNELLYGTGQGFTLFTGKGNIVSYDPNSKIVPYKPATLPAEMDDEFVRELTGLPNGISRIEGAAGPLMAVKSERYQLGWYLVTLTDERVFRSGVRDLYARFTGIGVLWFSLLIVFTIAISRYFTRPVYRLALQMDRIRGERFTAPVLQVKRTDEIGRLSRSFHMMLGRIQELLQTVKENEERKKEIELKLLLSQIRPHFLYNTLACIGSLAKQHRAAEVEETIRSLIQLLSYSLGKSEMVTLEEELQSLRSYVQIQKVRYGDAFHFCEEIDPSVLQMFVPKLIFQPLVENSIFHGLAAKGEGIVTIRARAEEGKLLLSVRDDGEGMTEAQIREALSDAEERVPKKSVSGFSIGLRNVQDRIRLNYGPAYGLQIVSEPGEWTDVTIALPLP